LKKRIEPLLLTIVLAVLISTRLIPAFTSNSLFSTDVWPLYRSSERILSIPEARIWDDKLFDGYNNHWPGVLLSTAIYTLITGVQLKDTYAYCYTAASSLATLVLLYALLRRFMGAVPSTLSILFYGLTPSLLIFTSTTIKEVYAYSSFYSTLLITYKVLAANSLKLEDFLITAALATGLVTSHHLATFMLLGFLLSTVVVSLVRVAREPRLSIQHGSIYRLLVLTLIIGAVGLAYYCIYGYRGFKVVVDTASVASYSAYALTIYGGYLILSATTRRRVSRSLIPPVLALVATFTTMLWVERALPGLSTPLNMVFWYIPPLAASLVLTALRVEDVVLDTTIVGASLFIALNTVYILFGNPLLTSILHRFLNYTPLIMSILVGYSFKSRRAPVKLYALSLITLAALSSAITLHSVLSGGLNISFYWYYPECECAGYDSISSLLGSGATLVGDDKVRYYYTLIREVAQKPLFEISYSKAAGSCGELFIVYAANYRVGLAVGLSIYKLPQPIVNNSCSRVFDNGCTQGFK